MRNEKLKQYEREEKQLDQQIEIVKQKQAALQQHKVGNKLHRVAIFSLSIFAISLGAGFIGYLLLGPASGPFEAGVLKFLGFNNYVALGSTFAFLGFAIPDAMIINRRDQKEQALKKELNELRDKSSQLARERNNQLTKYNQNQRSLKETPRSISDRPNNPTNHQSGYQKVKNKTSRK